MSNLNIGDNAPDFDLPADGGKNIKLKSLNGKNVVLYFYPKDDTPGCTTEAKDFRDLIAEFTKMNTVILGVSKDGVKQHDKFKEKYCLPFDLISDENNQIIDKFGLWVEKSMYGKKYMGIERATYIIDKTGKIVNIWRNVKVDGHAREVLEACSKLN